MIPTTTQNLSVTFLFSDPNLKFSLENSQISGIQGDVPMYNDDGDAIEYNQQQYNFQQQQNDPNIRQVQNHNHNFTGPYDDEDINQSQYDGDYSQNYGDGSDPQQIHVNNSSNLGGMMNNNSQYSHGHHTSEVYSSTGINDWKETIQESKTRSGDLKDVYGSNWTKQRSFRIHTPMNNHYPKTS
jgi:hypothetical protein